MPRKSKWASEEEIEAYRYENSCCRRTAIYNIRAIKLSENFSEPNVEIYRRNKDGVYVLLPQPKIKSQKHGVTNEFNEMAE